MVGWRGLVGRVGKVDVLDGFCMVGGQKTADFVQFQQIHDILENLVAKKPLLPERVLLELRLVKWINMIFLMPQLMAYTVYCTPKARVLEIAILALAK